MQSILAAGPNFRDHLCFQRSAAARQVIAASRPKAEARASAEIFARGVSTILRDSPDAATRKAAIGGMDLPPYFYDPKATVVTVGGPRADTKVSDVVRVSNEFPEGARPAFQEARGAIRIPADGAAAGKTVIELMETADASTFVHEAAHFFASLLDDLSARVDGDSPLKACAEAMRKKFGDMGYQCP